MDNQEQYESTSEEEEEDVESDQDLSNDSRSGSESEDGSIICEPWEKCPCNKVHSLTSIVMKSSMIEAMLVINYIDAMEDDGEIKEKKFKFVVDHFKPFREFLASAPMVYDIYEDQEISATKFVYGYCAYIFWLCFKNIEAQKIRIFSFYPHPHQDGGQAYIHYRINFISKSEESFNFCKSLTLEDQKNEITMDMKTFFKNGQKFPVLQELQIKFYRRQNLEEMLVSILPEMETVTKLHMSFTSYPDFLFFCDNIDRSQQLTNIEINCCKLYKINVSSKNRTVNLNTLLTALKKLKSLKHFLVFNWVPENYDRHQCVFPYLEPMEKLAKVDNVKSISLMEIILTDLMVIDQHFQNVQKLAIMVYPTKLNVTKLRMQSLTTITSLKIYNSNNRGRISYYLDIFPNLNELVFDVSVKEDVITEAKFLKKFIILQNKIRNPKMLLKMPKLEHFSMKWSKVKKLEEAKNIKPFLPLHCKMYERLKNDDIVEINV